MTYGSTREGENAKVRYFWRTYIRVCGEHPRFAETASIFTSRDKPETRLLERDGVKIGYVVVPHFSPRDNADGVWFETTAQNLIAQLDADHARAWVIDLGATAAGTCRP